MIVKQYCSRLALTSILLLAFRLTAFAQSTTTSVVAVWSFEASCTKPNTTLDGKLNIVFDSMSYIVGGVHLEDKILPFHGRHYGDRLLIRTDTGHFPIMRIDCTLDSSHEHLEGIATVSKVKAMEPGKKPKDYYDLAYDIYCAKSGTPMRPSHKTSTKSHLHKK